MPVWIRTLGGLPSGSATALAQHYRNALLLLLLLLSKVLALAPAHAAAPGTSANATPTRIHLSRHGWGSTDAGELQLVLDAVATELGSHFPNRRLGTIQVVPGAQNPMVLYQKGPNGEYVVQLSARNSRWYQFVYQFSHELCHIYSNYDNKDAADGVIASRNQWFEESLCEAAALFTLRRLASAWESAPPGERWTRHAALFRKYADLLLHEPHRRLPASSSFAAWFRDNHHALQASPYLREKDEVVSNLLLPLFEQDPAAWGAIGYLNAERADAAKRFRDYLEAWCRACPTQYRGVVERIIALFEAAAPAVPAAESQTS